MSLLKIAFPNSIFVSVGAFSLPIFKNDPELSCFPHFVLYNPFVRLSLCRRPHLTETSHTVLSSPRYKAFIFNLLRVLICFLER